MKELIRVRIQYASRQQCCKTHKRHLPLPFTLYIRNTYQQQYFAPFIKELLSLYRISLDETAECNKQITKFTYFTFIKPMEFLDVLTIIKSTFNVFAS